jgi:hypothetical protein
MNKRVLVPILTIPDLFVSSTATTAARLPQQHGYHSSTATTAARLPQQHGYHNSTATIPRFTINPTKAGHISIDKIEQMYYHMS